MQWFDSPPAARMKVTRDEPGLLVLEGPGVGTRIVGGAATAFGATFAGIAASFTRLPVPVPMPFRAIPLAFMGIGAGITAFGLGALSAKCSVTVSRDGIHWRWKIGPLKEHRLELAAGDVREIEVKRSVHTHSDDNGFERTSVSWVIYPLRQGCCRLSSWTAGGEKRQRQ